MKLQGFASVVACVAAATVACGGSSNPPSSGGNDGGSGGDRITGNERLGWNQTASDANELATFRYAAYVDTTNRSELTDVSCSPGGGSFSCSSRLPQMSSGAHTIELVSFVVDNGNVVESPRSAALRVTMAGSTAGADGAAAGSTSDHAMPRNAGSRDVTTRDGVQLRADVLTEDLESPTAVAQAPDGRVFIAERNGRMRIVNAGRLEPASAPLDDVMVVGQSDGGLIGFAFDPDFSTTHFIYALYTASDRDGLPTFRVARYREVGGSLGERVPLLDGVPASASAPAAAIAIGPDRRLYVAFDDAGDPNRAAAPSSYSGKILRLNTDGTTPDDHAPPSPIFADGQRAPRSLDWQAATGALWVIDQRQGAAGELRGMAADPTNAKGTTRVRTPFPSRFSASSMAFYDSDVLTAFRGDLFVVGGATGQLLRLRFQPRDPGRVASSESLLQDTFGPLTAVAVGLDGSLYLTTDRSVVRLGQR